VLEVVRPLTLILVAVFPKVYSVPFCLRVLPLSNIAVSMDSSPNSMTLFLALPPFAVVNLPFDPFIDPLPLSLVVLEFPLVNVARLISFISLTTPLIAFPFTFVHPHSSVVDHDTPALPLALAELALVDRAIVVLFDEKALLMF